MRFRTVKVINPDAHNMVLGQSHVVKTVDDIHNTLVEAVPGIRFGLAFNEASMPRLIRYSGTDESLIDLAKKNANNIGAVELFVLFMDNAVPIKVMKALKDLPAIDEIYCATANPIEVIVAETSKGRGVMGLVDDY